MIAAPTAATAPTALTGLDAPTGVPLLVLKVDLAGAGARRLAQHGIREGQTVRVLSRTAGGGRLLAAGIGRVALDGPTAALVHLGSAAAGAAS